MDERINIFGIDIDSIALEETVKILLEWISQREQSRFVVTPNVNHLVLFQENEKFRTAYRQAALVLPDGRYVILLSRILKTPLAGPVNGSDLVPALLESASVLGKIRVFLLGAMPGVAEKAAKNIENRWPHVDVVGVYSPPFGFEHDREQENVILSRIDEVAPDLLVVGITPPKQEIWVAEHLAQLKVPVTICAGGTIDFMANVRRRAPGWMQKAGLEWVFRAASEPKRLIPRYTRDGLAVLKLLYTHINSKWG